MKFVYKEYVLRKAEPRDAAELMRITNEDEIMKYYGESGAYLKNEEEALQEIHWYNNQLSKHAGMWVIAQQSTGEYIGDIGFNDFVKEHNKAEVGYKLKKEYWGKGIISSFINQIVDYGFHELHYHRIEAVVDVHNFASKQVLIKNKFVLEGVLRESEFEYGHYVDLEMYSILQKDFEKIQ